MLFHVEHTHTAESCPYHKPDAVKKTWGQVMPSKIDGLEVLGGYIDAPAHTFYFIVETDRAEKIEEWLAPAISTGVVKTSPVIDYKDILARRAK